MMGVLPQTAADFGVSIPAAGYLISGYALGVVIGAPLLTAAAVRLPRKTMLLAMMGLFSLGNGLFALSPNQEFGVAFRFLAGLPHGAFFGAGAVVASSLAKEGQRAKAVSLMFLGLTLANVIGGRLADRALMPSLYVALIALATVLAIFSITVQGKFGAAVTIFFVGVAGFMIGPMMQARIMEKAGGTPSLVSAAVQSAFNIANSIGAYLGGLVIAGGLGLVAPNWVGAVLAVVGLSLAPVSGTLDRRETRQLALAS